MKHLAFIALAMALISCAHPIHRELPCTDCADVSIRIAHQNESNPGPNINRLFLAVEASGITEQNKDRYACCIMRSLYQNQEIRYDAMRIHLYSKIGKIGDLDNVMIAEMDFAPNGKWDIPQPNPELDDFQFTIDWRVPTITTE